MKRPVVLTENLFSPSACPPLDDGELSPERFNSTAAFLEFFAGSGLVAEGLRPFFKAIWANDICPKKAAVYAANHGTKHFRLASIAEISGAQLPGAVLSWASFPCQDLSLAGLSGGIHAKRSGMVWQWLRIMDEMTERPPLLVAENVTGLVSANGGHYYRSLHQALRARGYAVGAVVIDAVRWVPQSRARVFVIAIDKNIVVPRALKDETPNWMHTKALLGAARGLEDFIWWKAPEPPARTSTLLDIIEWDIRCDAPEDAAYKLSLIPNRHLERLRNEPHKVAPGYKRTRAAGQVLELRFDGIAGCLRTAEGGSSRQVVVLKRGTHYETRLLSVRETARLMGAPDTYQLPGSYNDGYTAMGDAVAVPVARFLAQNLLAPLAQAARSQNFVGAKN